MPKNNKLNNDITQYSLLIGDANNQIKSIPIAPAGQFLIPNGGAADPSFTDNLTIDFPVSNAGACTMTISNTSNTAGSDAKQVITVTSGTAGDAYTEMRRSTTQCVLGLDNSDNDRYKIGAGNALGAGDVFIANTDGSVVMPNQPCFLAFNTADRINATGDGSLAVVTYNSAVFNRGSYYNTGTNTWTMPASIISGTNPLLHVTTTVRVSNLSNTHTSMRVYFAVGASQYSGFIGNPYEMRDASGEVAVNISTFLNAAYSTTIQVVVVVSGGTKTVTIEGNATDLVTFFAGRVIGG